MVVYRLRSFYLGGRSSVISLGEKGKRWGIFLKVLGEKGENLGKDGRDVREI